MSIQVAQWGTQQQHRLKVMKGNISLLFVFHREPLQRLSTPHRDEKKNVLINMLFESTISAHGTPNHPGTLLCDGRGARTK